MFDSKKQRVPNCTIVTASPGPDNCFKLMNKSLGKQNRKRGKGKGKGGTWTWVPVLGETWKHWGNYKNAIRFPDYIRCLKRVFRIVCTVMFW